ncbi:hypothetical protein EV361DRAFT_811257, partial [Lentinula raphanica]
MQKDFLNVPLNKETLRADISLGGKKILDLYARNDAIAMMQLKSYLELDPYTRPVWAYLADVILARRCAEKQKVTEELRVNPFLQLWKPQTRKLPKNLARMMKVAKKYGV